MKILYEGVTAKHIRRDRNVPRALYQKNAPKVNTSDIRIVEAGVVHLGNEHLAKRRRKGNSIRVV